MTNDQTDPLNRRGFIKTAVAAGGAVAATGAVQASSELVGDAASAVDAQDSQGKGGHKRIAKAPQQW